MSAYDPASYLELWVPEQDMKDATGKSIGVKRTLRARVPFDEAVQRMVPLLTFSVHEDESQAKYRREWARLLLRAALGEGT